MATDSLMFDLLAKDSASGAFRDLSRSAMTAAGEMHAAFAEPVEAKIKTEGFEEYMAKLAEVRAANDLSIGEIQARTMKLTEGAEAAGRELDAMAAHMDGAGNAADRNRGKLSRLLDTLGGLGKGAGVIGGGGALAGLGGAGAAGLMVGIGGLASALTAAAGAGGLLGLAVGGNVVEFMKLNKQITAAQTALAGATPGTAAYAKDQAHLTDLLKAQHQQFGPMMAGVGALSSAWDGFLGKTKGPTMRLMGEGLKIAADALKQFAPVVNAAARAMEPLLKQVDHWVKGSGFKEFLDYLRTTGSQALGDFVHFIGEATKGFLDLMVALAPVGQKMADFLGRLGSGGALATLGVVLGGVAAALIGITGPVALVVAGMGALGAVMIVAWKHSAQFRAVARSAFREVQSSLGQLVSAAQGFWAQWGDLIKKLGLGALETFVKQAGHQLSAFFHLAAALLDLFSGNWKGAWKNIKAFAVNEVQGILAPFAAVWGAVEGGASAAWQAITKAVSSGVSNVVGWVARLPGRIMGALGGLAGKMFDIGTHAMQGLLNGLESLAGAVASKIASIASSIPGKFASMLGIHSPSRVMHAQGQHVMDGLIHGLKSREKALKVQLTNTVNTIKDALSFGDNFAGNVFSASLPTSRNVKVPGQVHRQVVNGQTIITSTPATTQRQHLSHADILAEMFDYQRGQRHQARRLDRFSKKLSNEGLSKSLFDQMAAGGAEGMAEIAALASATPAQVKRFNRLNAQTNHALSNAGAQAVTGKNMAALRREKAHEQAQIRTIRKALHGLEVKVHGHKLRVMG